MGDQKLRRLTYCLGFIRLNQRPIWNSRSVQGHIYLDSPRKIICNKKLEITIKYSIKR